MAHRPRATKIANAQRWLKILEASQEPAKLVQEDYDNFLRALETTLQKQKRLRSLINFTNYFIQLYLDMLIGIGGSCIHVRHFTPANFLTCRIVKLFY